MLLDIGEPVSARAQSRPLSCNQFHKTRLGYGGPVSVSGHSTKLEVHCLGKLSGHEATLRRGQVVELFALRM